MKAFIVLAALLVAVSAEDFCYKDVTRACRSQSAKQKLSISKCNATFGAIDVIVPDLREFTNTHIVNSFEYLLMSTHYANFEKSRAGFEKFFRGLSDSKWEEAIELIKYITKRGGEMKFRESDYDTNEQYELLEIEGLAKSLDIEKKLTAQAYSIHEAAVRKRHHDPEVSSFIEKEYLHKQASLIRKISGHITDLSSLLVGPDSSLSLYMFDEYLQKQ